MSAFTDAIERVAGPMQASNSPFSMLGERGVDSEEVVKFTKLLASQADSTRKDAELILATSAFTYGFFTGLEYDNEE